MIGADIMIPRVPLCALTAGCGRQKEVASPSRSLDQPAVYGYLKLMLIA